MFVRSVKDEMFVEETTCFPCSSQINDLPDFLRGKQREVSQHIRITYVAEKPAGKGSDWLRGGREGLPPAAPPPSRLGHSPTASAEGEEHTSHDRDHHVSFFSSFISVRAIKNVQKPFWVGGGAATLGRTVENQLTVKQPSGQSCITVEVKIFESSRRSCLFTHRWNPDLPQSQIFH